MEAKKSYIDKKNGRKSVVVSKQKEEEKNMTNLTWKERLEKLREEKGGKLTKGTMKPENMAILLELYYDTIDTNITNVMKLLIGNDFALGFNDGFFGSLTKIGDVIIRKEISPDIMKYEQDCIDMDDSIFDNVIESEDLTYLEKAKILLGYYDKDDNNKFDINICFKIHDLNGIALTTNVSHKLHRLIDIESFDCKTTYDPETESQDVIASVEIVDREQIHDYFKNLLIEISKHLTIVDLTTGVNLIENISNILSDINMNNLCDDISYSYSYPIVNNKNENAISINFSINERNDM